MQSAVYLDYNATTPIAPEVQEAMLPFLKHQFGNPSSTYSLGNQAKEAVEKARAQVARLIGAKPHEIVFTSGGTEANNLAILGTLAALDANSHLITSAIEHPAIINVCMHLEQKGHEVSYIPVDKKGRVELPELEKSIQNKTGLITVMHSNNEVGTFQPITEIGALASKHKILFHTDASQSIGKCKIDVNNLNVDLLTLAGHKVYAPKGVGALYVKEGTKIRNILFGASQEKGLRPGTENVMQIVGLGAACALAEANLENNILHMKNMRDALLSQLTSHLGDRIVVNGDLENGLPNTLNIQIKKIDSHALAESISDNVMLSTGSACHSGKTTISSVLNAMGLSIEEAKSTLRISSGKYTTTEDIEFAAAHIIKHVNEF